MDISRSLGSTLFAALVQLCIFNSAAVAEDSLLTDINGDGAVSYLAFGDSLTYGLGDGIAPGAEVYGFEGVGASGGYPKRIAALAQIAVSNQGIPGEEINEGGVARFANVIGGSSADLVSVLEGFNDSIGKLETSQYRSDLQKMINVSHYFGKSMLLMTLPTPCCGHAGESLFTNSYSNVVSDLGLLNDLPVVDLRRAWRTTCVNSGECELFNLPEGLHPNTLGYDVIAQTILASLYGIDIFVEGGAAELEGTLGLEPGSVVVKPEAIVAQ